MRRTTTCLLSSVVAAGLVAGPAPSHAAQTHALTIAELQAQLADCNDGDVVHVDDDIIAPEAQLDVGCSVTVDLGNATVEVRNVVIGPGLTFTIAEPTLNELAPGGTFVADASGTVWLAGIQNTGATLVVTGRAHVRAYGGVQAAAIGGASSGDTGESGGTTIVRNRSDVSAVGGEGAAGIGGGFGGYGGGRGGTTETYDLGLVNATGGDGGAGIGGGGYYGNGGTTTATGRSRVYATGGSGAAGIGGGAFGAGGTTSVHDEAEVVGAGGGYGAGIGGGQMNGGGTTVVTGRSAVVARGGAEAAGIGGGGGIDDDTGPYGGGEGGSVRVVGGTVTASGGHTAIGSGAFHQGNGGWGSLEVSTNGVLRLPKRRLLVLESGAGPEVVVRSGGRITGAARIAGDGQIANHGAILMPAHRVYPTTVTDHAYRVTFDARGGTPRTRTRIVYAASFAQAGLAFPSRPRKPGATFDSWNRRPRGTGSELTTGTRLVRVNGSVCPGLVPVTAYAQYRASGTRLAARAASSPQQGCIA